jgi:hypothetical protein
MDIEKSLKYKIFRRDNFTCQYCGKQTPKVVLNVDSLIPITSVSTNNETELITVCQDCCNERQAIPVNERQEQIEAYEKFLLERQKEQSIVIEELGEYWSLLCDNQYELNEHGLESLKKFLVHLVPFEIRESMDIAADKIPNENIGERFKYFCGICHNKIREKSGDTTWIFFNEIKNYYLNKPRGSGYYKKDKLKEFCRTYDKEVLIRAIDIAFSEPRPSYWRAFCEVLEDLTGDSLEY